MRREENDREPRREAADADPISYTPGAMEDKESASAQANRTGAPDTTSLRPERSASAGTETGEDAADPDGGTPGGSAPDGQGPGTVADPLR